MKRGELFICDYTTDEDKTQMTIRELVNHTDKRTKLVIIAGGMQLDMDAMIEAVGTDQGALVVSVADSYTPKHLERWQYAKPGTHPNNVEVR